MNLMSNFLAEIFAANNTKIVKRNRKKLRQKIETAYRATNKDSPRKQVIHGATIIVDPPNHYEIGICPSI